MERRLSSDRIVAAALDCARRHWESGRTGLSDEDTPPEVTIAITREAGARGAEVAQALGLRLSWPVYDKELLQRIAEEMGLRASLLESVDEKRGSWLRECMEAFFSVPSVNVDAYARHLVETLLSLAAHGACVVVGRGAAQVLPPMSTLRVRLVADRRDRIASIQQRMDMSREEAEKWIEKTDRERTQFVTDRFLKDPSDPHIYDLVLNTSRWSVPECVDIVVRALERMQSRAAGKTPRGFAMHA